MEDLQECISRCMSLSIVDMPSCSVVCAQYLRTPQRRHNSFGKVFSAPAQIPVVHGQCPYSTGHPGSSTAGQRRAE